MTDNNRFIEFIKRDLLYIIVCLLAILACVYTIESVQEFQDHCNIYWTDQVKDCNCGTQQFNNWSENFTLMLPLQEIGIGVDDDNKDHD